MRGVSSIKRIKFVVFIPFFFSRVVVLVVLGITDLYSVCGNNSFLYDGKRIDDHNTPGSLDMEDDGTVVSFFQFPCY